MATDNLRLLPPEREHDTFA